MPFTSQQQEALRALEWLHSDELYDRRSGRSIVLAIDLLRRMFRTGQMVFLNVIRERADAETASIAWMIEYLGLTRWVRGPRPSSYDRGGPFRTIVIEPLGPTPHERLERLFSDDPLVGLPWESVQEEPPPEPVVQRKSRYELLVEDDDERL